MARVEFQRVRMCDKNHGYPRKPSVLPNKTLCDAEIDSIVDRLYKTHTVSSSGNTDESPMVAKDVISKKPASATEVRLISHRLHNMPTSAMLSHDDKQMMARDQISKEAVKEGELDMIVDRLFQTHTLSSSSGGPPIKLCVAKKVESEEEVQEIFERLRKTHTKSSAGGEECRPWDRIQPPGYGLKSYPVINGLETRFSGSQSSSEETLTENYKRIRTSHTKASQARLDNPQILLYPERTSLMNNPQRIRDFQASGSVTKQNVMERREKWYN